MFCLPSHWMRFGYRWVRGCASSAQDCLGYHVLSIWKLRIFYKLASFVRRPQGEPRCRRGLSRASVFELRCSHRGATGNHRSTETDSQFYLTISSKLVTPLCDFHSSTRLFLVPFGRLTPSLLNDQLQCSPVCYTRKWCENAPNGGLL